MATKRTKAASEITDEQSRQSNERNASQTHGKWTNGTNKRPQIKPGNSTNG